MEKILVITAGPTLKEIVIRTPTEPRPITVVPAKARIKIASALPTFTPIADACSGSKATASKRGWAHSIKLIMSNAVKPS
jgi:hypothetical protein